MNEEKAIKVIAKLIEEKEEIIRYRAWIGTNVIDAIELLFEKYMINKKEGLVKWEK